MDIGAVLLGMQGGKDGVKQTARVMKWWLQAWLASHSTTRGTAIRGDKALAYKQQYIFLLVYIFVQVVLVYFPLFMG